MIKTKTHIGSKSFSLVEVLCSITLFTIVSSCFIFNILSLKNYSKSNKKQISLIEENIYREITVCDAPVEVTISNNQKGSSFLIASERGRQKFFLKDVKTCNIEGSECSGKFHSMYRGIAMKPQSFVVKPINDNHECEYSAMKVPIYDDREISSDISIALNN